MGANCDMCDTFDSSTEVIGQQDLIKAVVNGFDPFELGLMNDHGLGAARGSEWRKQTLMNTIMSYPTWSLCKRCIRIARKHLLSKCEFI